MTQNPSKPTVRLHLTNVVGAGATQLLQSLLPALERDSRVEIESIELPDRGSLSAYQSQKASTVQRVYRRYLPNVVSRILECTALASRFDGNSPLLVLGDLPLRSAAPQTVFVQTSNLLRPANAKLNTEAVKYWIARLVFRINMKGARSFIVQTAYMRDALIKSYPELAGRVHVIGQPVPSWLLDSGLKRPTRTKRPSGKLSLIYPAASYSHKNHALLSNIGGTQARDWPVEKLTLTLDPAIHPAPQVAWIHCSGFLGPAEMIQAYSEADALLFLSREESYGFPLVEAMFVGLPIICPDLPYARVLCKDEAIYFDPASIDSLRDAVLELDRRLKDGWWPNWDSHLSGIPSNWDAVASRMLDVACMPGCQATAV